MELPHEDDSVSRMRFGFDPLVGERGGIGWLTFYLPRALLDLDKEV